MPATREQFEFRADQAEINARHARLAAQDAQNASDAAFAAAVARRHDLEAAELRRQARRG